MNHCYCLKLADSNVPQAESDRSFLGGRPRLPVTEQIPSCRLCGAEQAFFFQVAFPDDTDWGGRSLAVFACISCASDGQLIPEMLEGPLRGVDVPEGFLDSYQRNFRFIVFPTEQGVLHEEYAEKVRFTPFRVEPSPVPAIPGNKLGGIPTWILEDETPGSYAGRYSLTFLLQLEPDFELPIVEGAPQQIEIALDGKPTPADRPSYELFIGNALYLFGVEDGSRSLVYAITQVD